MKKENSVAKSLPCDGMSRWRTLSPFIPFSRETFRKLVLAGKAPQPHKMGVRCTYWKNSEILEFLADIPGYRAPQKAKTPKTLSQGG